MTESIVTSSLSFFALHLKYSSLSKHIVEEGEREGGEKEGVGNRGKEVRWEGKRREGVGPAITNQSQISVP